MGFSRRLLDLDVRESEINNKVEGSEVVTGLEVDRCAGSMRKVDTVRKYHGHPFALPGSHASRRSALSFQTINIPVEYRRWRSSLDDFCFLFELLSSLVCFE